MVVIENSFWTDFYNLQSTGLEYYGPREFFNNNGAWMGTAQSGYDFKCDDNYGYISLIWTIIDILLVTVLLYVLFSFLKRKNCTRLIKYIVALIVISVVLGSNLNQTYGLKMMGYLAGMVLVIAILAVLVLFSQDIKRTLWKISSPKDESAFFQTDYGCTEDQLYDLYFTCRTEPRKLSKTQPRNAETTTIR